MHLRPATPEDRFRIRRWLADPQLRAWRDNAASAEAQITLAMASEAALCRIIEDDGAPVGYVQAVEIGLWGRQQQPDDLAPGTWDVDLFVAAAAPDARQVQRAALTLLVEEVFATRLAVACCAVVPVRNEAAARACEQAGFRWTRVWLDPVSGPCWVMLRDRPQAR
jgi:RimJ/RimL family protein N-acetyltransferase